jgi:hypothetical protein
MNRIVSADDINDGVTVQTSGPPVGVPLRDDESGEVK